MVLQGFHYVSWIGWLTGTYFTQKPWGKPEFSWISPHTIYALVFNVISAIKWLDFIFKAIVYFQGHSLVSQIMNLCLIIAGISFGVITKFLFLFKGKRIANLLQKLLIMEKLIVPEVSRAWRWSQSLIYLTCTYQIGSSLVVPVFLYQFMPDASFSFIVSPYYFFLFFLFGAYAVTASFTTAYVFLIVTTNHVLFIIEKLFADVIEQVERQSLFQKGKNRSSRSNALTMSLETDTTVVKDLCDTSGSLTREDFIQKIEDVLKLCRDFDAVTGPIFLIIFVRTVFFLIHSADAILLGDSSDLNVFNSFKLIFGYIHLLFEIGQLCLILIGSYVHHRIDLRKYQLEKSIFLLNKCSEKEDFQEVLSLIKSWNWRLTAAGIFVVDMPLISGVVATMMSYVVILFQVNLADPDIPKPTLNSTFYKAG